MCRHKKKQMPVLLRIRLPQGDAAVAVVKEQLMLVCMKRGSL
jgi:hypothetical protein